MLPYFLSFIYAKIEKVSSIRNIYTYFNLYFTQFFRLKMMYFVVVNSADEINNEISEKMNLMVGVYYLVHVIRFIPLQRGEV